MTKVRVPVLGTVGKSVSIEADAPSRTEMNAAIAAAVANITAQSAATQSAYPTLWRLIREIPANIVKLAALTGNGLATRLASGNWAVRTLTAGSAISVTNGSGDAGNPTVALSSSGAVINDVWTWNGSAWALLPNKAMRGATFVNTAALVPPVNDVMLKFDTACVIKKVTLLTIGGTGSCVVDIRKKAYSSYPPTSGDSICAGAKPTISGGIKYEDSTLTGWTTAISAGDVIAISLVSSSTFSMITLQMDLGRA